MFWTIVLWVVGLVALWVVVHHVVRVKMYPRFMLAEVKRHNGKLCKRSTCNPEETYTHRGYYLHNIPAKPKYNGKENSSARIEACIKAQAKDKSHNWLLVLVAEWSKNREQDTYMTALAGARADREREVELQRRESVVAQIQKELSLTDAEKFDRLMEER